MEHIYRVIQNNLAKMNTQSRHTKILKNHREQWGGKRHPQPLEGVAKLYVIQKNIQKIILHHFIYTVFSHMIFESFCMPGLPFYFITLC